MSTKTRMMNKIIVMKGDRTLLMKIVAALAGGPFAPASSMAAISSSVKGASRHVMSLTEPRKEMKQLTNIGSLKVLLKTLFLRAGATEHHICQSLQMRNGPQY